MQDFLVENWKYIAIAISILGYLGYDKFAAILAKLKPAIVGKTVQKTTVVTSTDEKVVEASDMDAIIHLRNRAVAVKDKALLLEIKNVSGKFFDLHSIIDNSGK